MQQLAKGELPSLFEYLLDAFARDTGANRLSIGRDTMLLPDGKELLTVVASSPLRLSPLRLSRCKDLCGG